MRQCPHCGWQVAEGVSACPTCGAALGADDAPDAAASPTGATSGEASTLPGQPEALTHTWPSATPQGFTPYPAPPTTPGYPTLPDYPGGTAGGYPSSPGYTPYPDYGPYPGYAPYAGSPGYPGYPGQPGATSPAPARKRYTGLIVLIVALVAVLLVSCVGGTVAALRAASFGLSVVSSVGTEVAATATAAANAAPNAGATATTQPATTPGQQVVLSDPMTTPDFKFPNDDNCAFKPDGYHIIGGWDCPADTNALSDFTMQVQAELLKGPTDLGFGLTLRQWSDGNSYYFYVSGNGQWIFLKCVNSACTNIVDWTANSAIPTGQGKVNLLKVTMTGDHFDFYDNGTHLGSVTDATYSAGLVALTGEYDDHADVRFTNVLITAPSN